MEIILPDNFIKEDILEFIHVIEEAEQTATAIIREIVKQLIEVKASLSIFIAIVILKRVLECVNSIRLLSLLGLRRDAAILLLNLIELRLDIMYIELDEKHANEWLNHEKEYKKPWNVRFLFNELYKNESELGAELNIYKQLSMIKHGNPLGGLESFPMELSKKGIILRDEKTRKIRKENMIAVYLFGCGQECCNISNAVIGIGKKYGFNLSAFEHRILQLKDVLSKLNTLHIHGMLSGLIDTVNKPELCKSCVAIPLGVIEIACVLRQSRQRVTGEEFVCDRYEPIK